MKKKKKKPLQQKKNKKYTYRRKGKEVATKFLKGEGGLEEKWKEEEATTVVEGKEAVTKG